ncbi:MAG TPA: septum formation initiator family protein [Acidimicrobiales bacterium]
MEAADLSRATRGRPASNRSASGRSVPRHRAGAAKKGRPKAGSAGRQTSDKAGGDKATSQDKSAGRRERTGRGTGDKDRAGGKKERAGGRKGRAGGRKERTRASTRRPAGRRRGEPRPRAVARVRRRRLMVVVAAVFAAVVLATSFPASGLLDQHRQLSAANAAVHRLQSENKALTVEQKQLNSKAEIQRLARLSYQLVDPGQTAYNVLPPGAQSTGKGGSVAEDPGNQPLVAPANAAGMSPDPGLPNTPTTSPQASTSSQARASSGAATSGASRATKPAAQPTGGGGGFWSRTLHTLEFWR